MAFTLTKEYVEKIKLLIEAQDTNEVKVLTEELHQADIAELFKELDVNQAKFIFSSLSTRLAANVLVELQEDQTEKLLALYSAKEIANDLMDSLESDDAAYILSNLDGEKKAAVLAQIKDLEQASDIVDILNYQEGTAGALMAKELIVVKDTWTVAECTKEIKKKAQEIDQILKVYVTSSQDQLVGTLSLKAVLVSNPKTLIKRKFNKNFISVSANQQLEEVANLMDKYDLVVVPVVNELGQLLGRITIDDVIDFIKDEADKDYQIASGYSQMVESSDSVFTITRSRLPWLLIGLFGGILGSRVIAQYEDQIQLHPEMAYFIPLIAAMAGNAGVQSSAIVVQSLANKTMGLGGFKRKLLKEIYVSLLNGTACSIVIFVYTLIVGSSLSLGLTISSALFSVIIFATLFGAITPLVLNRYKIDPAIATGPFITTINDILGLIIYFLIGKVMYGG